MPMSKTAAVATMLLLALQLQGCGRKGPLYMQQAPAKPAPAVTVQDEPKNIDSSLPAQSQPVQTHTESQKQP